MLTPKQEKFCIEYLRGGNATAAYKLAYPKSQTWSEPAVNVEASRMLDNPKISLRVAELRKATDITVESILAELLTAQQIAQREGQAGAYVQAAMAKAKLAKLIDDQPAVVVNNNMPSDAAPDLASLRTAVQQRRSTQDVETKH